MKPSQVIEWREALGGRRFLMCMGAALVNTALFAFGLLSEGGYMGAFGMTVGAYLTATGWQQHVETRGSSN